MMRLAILSLTLMAFPAFDARAEPGGPVGAGSELPMTREAVSAAARAGVSLIGNDQIAARRAANPDLLLIDVRTESEFALGRIPGAVSIPRGVLEFRMAETVRQADREIIVYCSTGNRAALALKALRAQGYDNVSAHAGFETWAKARRPVETDAGLFQMIEATDPDR